MLTDISARGVERYRVMIEALPEAVVVCTLDGWIVEGNPAAAHLLGCSRDELPGQSLLDLARSDTHRGFADVVETAAQLGRAEGSGRIHCRDGGVVHVEGRAVLFPEANAQHLLVTLRDVTERQQAEQGLRDREEQYRSIFEATADAMAIIDPDGYHVEVNDAACRLYGYSRDELIGMHMSQMTDPNDHEFIDPALHEVRGGGPGMRIVRLIRKDGSRFLAETQGTMLMYRGTPHFLGIARDITERLEAERAVQAERQRLSRELHDSVSQALYGIGMGAQTTRILLETNPAEARQANDYVLSLAEAALAEMRALIFDLRPEALAQEGLIPALQRRADAVQARHGLRVAFAAPPEPDAPLAVKQALYRIAQEAMQNTVKHAGSSTIHLNLRQTDDSVVLEVRDDGRGFDASADFPGHLGLRSMQERAARLGGILQVESAPGRGTHVCASLPRRPV